MLKKDVGIYLGIVVAMVFWSLSFIWYKDAYVNFGPMTTVFLRLFISSVILLSISVFTKQLNILKSDLKLFFAAAFFEPFLYFVGESFGMQFVSSVTASVIIATIPVLTPICMYMWGNEKLSVLNISGIVISFTGVAMVIFKKNMQITASPIGILLMFVAVVAAIGYAMALKKLTPHYTPITIVAVQNTIGTILFAPLFLCFEYHSFLSNMSVNAMIPVLKLSVFASSIAFILYAYGVKKIGVSKANTFANLIPVLTSIFAFYLLGEELSAFKMLGIVVVVSGLFLSQVRIGFYHNVIKLFVGTTKNTPI